MHDIIDWIAKDAGWVEYTSSVVWGEFGRKHCLEAESGVEAGRTIFWHTIRLIVDQS